MAGGGQGTADVLLRYRPLTVERVTGQASRTGDGRRPEYACYHLRDGWELPAVTTVPTGQSSGKMRLILADEGRQGTEALAEDALREQVTATEVEVVMQGACGLGKAPHQWTMMLASSGGRMLGLQVAQLAAVMHHMSPARPDPARPGVAAPPGGRGAGSRVLGDRPDGSVSLRPGGR